MLFAKVIIYSDMTMKYAEKHNENTPARMDFLSGRWVGLLLSKGGGR